jgi:hypothetical protein
MTVLPTRMNRWSVLKSRLLPTGGDFINFPAQQCGLLVITDKGHWVNQLHSHHHQQQQACFASSSFPMKAYKTSGRQQKRRQRQRTRSKETQGQVVKVAAAEKQKEVEVDTRTWRTILFPPIVKDHTYKPPSSNPWPRSPKKIYQLFSAAWIEYKETWEGFFNNLSGKKPDAVQDTTGITTTQPQRDIPKELHDNVQRNLKVSREEGRKLVEEAQRRTGIYSMEEAKALAKEMLTVATLMLAEFMKEYRKGRDDEADKMMNVYFQEEENMRADEVIEKKKRRPPKRRIPGRLLN